MGESDATATGPSMIVEGLLSTQRDDGAAHVAPMGPVVSEDFTRWTLRPFQTSTTFKLLRSNPVGIFHIVDDVLPVVQAALGQPLSLEFLPHAAGGQILTSACRWFRLEITDWDLSSIRSEAHATVHSSGHLRDFWGWNRAKHAVLEATILATRVHLLEQGEVEASLAKLEVAVTKTAGKRELDAWKLLQNYFVEYYGHADHTGFVDNKG